MILTDAELRGYIERFLRYGAEVRNFSPHTIESYRRDLTQLHEWVCTLPDTPVRFDYPLIGRYLYYRVTQCKVSPRSMNRALSAFKSIIKYLIASEDIISTADRAGLQTLLLHIRGARTPHKLPVHIPVEQMNKIIPEPVDFTTARDAALIESLYSTGCRISELLSIDVSQATGARVRIAGKGGRQREVYLGARAQSALKCYLSFRGEAFSDTASGSSARAADCEALFVNHRGKRLTRQGANTILKKYNDALSLQSPLSAHVFRHSFATHILDAGADIRVVQELLGHAQLSSTQIYTHVSTAKMQRAYRQAHPHASHRRAGDRS